MASERREHRIAVEILYAVEVGKTPLDEALGQAKAGLGVFGRGDEAIGEDPYEPLYPAVDRRYDAPRGTNWKLVEELVSGTLAHKAELEAKLSALLKRWTIDRLSGIDRLILDLGAWELRFRENAQTAAVINHAVELAHRLSGEKSGRFINGVLDAFLKSPPRVAS